MAYTNTWDDSRPPGTQLAKNIDDEFRVFRVDVHERMNSLVVDWLADPVVLQGSMGGAKTGKIVYINHAAFDIISPVPLIPLSISRGEVETINTSASNQDFIAPTWIPGNMTITRLRAIVRNSTGSGTITVALDSISFDVSRTLTNLCFGTTVASGVSVLDTGVLGVPPLTPTNAATYIKITLPASASLGSLTASFSSVEITYNSPGAGSSI